MKIIGLTGGSGTGKGTVAARMRSLGAGWWTRTRSTADSVRKTAQCWTHWTRRSAA